MNKKPIWYLQTDSRWSGLNYKGMSCREGGCGPTCAAMLIATLTEENVTPADTWKWAGDHGFLSPGHGTEYGSYFQDQFKEYELTATMLSWTNTYGKPDHPNHDLLIDKLKEGYYAIALMNKGLWTRSGHFVVVWWADDKIRINDPASTKIIRLNGDPKTFKSQAKYYWLIDARAYNNPPKEEEEDMTQEKFDEMFALAMKSYRQGLKDNDSSAWSKEAREWAIKNKIFAGDGAKNPNFMWEDLMTREQCAQILYKFAEQNDLL